MTTTRNARRSMIGIVRSAKTAKTISVEVERTYKHAKYGKYLRKRKRYLVHDEKGEAREGDQVEVESTRPLSKLKRFRLVRIVSRSELSGVHVVDPTAEMVAEVTAKKHPKKEEGEQ
jgi:small subunit ribosomal protein S17